MINTLAPPPPHPNPQILRNDGLMRPLVVTTVDRLDLVMGLMGAQVRLGLGPRVWGCDWRLGLRAGLD
jgi:hypothetical protein